MNAFIVHQEISSSETNDFEIQFDVNSYGSENENELEVENDSNDYQIQNRSNNDLGESGEFGSDGMIDFEANQTLPDYMNNENAIDFTRESQIESDGPVEFVTDLFIPAHAENDQIIRDKVIVNLNNNVEIIQPINRNDARDMPLNIEKFI
jgi:hypothetical protein